MTEIEKLKRQVQWMQEMIIALVIVQDRIAQFRIRNANPQLDDILNRMWIKLP